MRGRDALQWQGAAANKQQPTVRCMHSLRCRLHRHGAMTCGLRWVDNRLVGLLVSQLRSHCPVPPAPRGVEASRQVARDHQPTLVVRCPIANPVPGSEPGKGDGVACLSGGVHEALRNPPIGIAVTPSLPSQKYEHASQKSHVVLGLGIRARGRVSAGAPPSRNLRHNGRHERDAEGHAARSSRYVRGRLQVRRPSAP